MVRGVHPVKGELEDLRFCCGLDFLSYIFDTVGYTGFLTTRRDTLERYKYAILYYTDN